MIYARSSLTARPVAAPRSSVRIAPVRPSVVVRADPGDELKQGARDVSKNVSDHRDIPRQLLLRHNDMHSCRLQCAMPNAYACCTAKANGAANCRVHTVFGSSNSAAQEILLSWVSMHALCLPASAYYFCLCLSTVAAVLHCNSELCEN